MYNLTTDETIFLDCQPNTGSGQRVVDAIAIQPRHMQADSCDASGQAKNGPNWPVEQTLGNTVCSRQADRDGGGQRGGGNIWGKGELMAAILLIASVEQICCVSVQGERDVDLL